MTPEQESRLIAAMTAANTPITQRLDAVNAHLRELNGKVASHAVLHEGSRVRFETFGERLSNLERRGDEPGRREEDKAPKSITKWDVTVFAAGATAMAGVLLWLLKLLGKL